MQTSHKVSKNQSQRGQTLVEFALVLMFIILPLIFVLVDGSLLLFTYAEVTNAAREAARAAAIYQCSAPTCILNPTTDYDVQAAVIDAGRLQYVDSYFNNEDTRWLNALIGYSTCTRAIAYPVPVYNSTNDTSNVYREMDPLILTLSCPRRLLFGLVGTSQITLTASATMRIEPGGVAQ